MATPIPPARTTADAEALLTMIRSGHLTKEQTLAAQREVLKLHATAEGRGGEQLASVVGATEDTVPAAGLGESSGATLRNIEALGEGVVNTVVGMADFVAKPGRTDEEIVAVKEARARAAAEQRIQDIAVAKSQGIGTAGFTINRAIGEMLPESGASVFAGILKGAGKRIMAEGLIGGLFGAASNPNEEAAVTAQAAAQGALFGSGLTAVTEIPIWGTKFLLANTQAMARMRYGDNVDPGNPYQIDDVAKELDMDLTLGEATQDQLTKAMEMSVAQRPGGPKQVFADRRTDQAIAAYGRVADALNPERISTEQLITLSRQATDTLLEPLNTRAGEAFLEDLAPAIELSGSKLLKDGTIVGGERILPANNLLKALDGQLQILTKNDMVGGTPEHVAFLKKTIADIQTGGDKISLSTAQRTLQMMREMTTGVGQVSSEVQRMATTQVDARAITNAILDDLRDTAARPDLIEVPLRSSRGQGSVIGPEVPPPGPVDPATTLPGQPGDPAANIDVPFERFIEVENDDKQRIAQSLLDARANYSSNVKAIQDIKGIATDQFLAKVGYNSPEQFIERFNGMVPTSKVKMLEMLDAHRPGLANVLRARALTDTMQKHTILSSRTGLSTGDIPDVDFQGFAQEIAGGKWGLDNVKAMYPTGAISPEDAVKARAGIIMLAKVQADFLPANASRATGFDAASRTQDVLRNAISLDPIFAGGLIGKLGGQHVLTKLLFTDSGVRWLVTLGQSNIKGTQAATIVNNLGRLMLEADTEKAQRQKEMESQLIEEKRQQATLQAGFPR